MKMSTSERIILLVILAVGSFLRFHGEWAFMPDEISALSRLRFDSFSELIEKGVAPDGHPAFVHVFLYFWTGLFGNSELAVKLPSVILGISSIYLLFKAGKRLFSINTGLLASAFLATIQFAVLYSTIARPYVYGLFFCLLQINYLLDIKEGKSSRRVWVMLILVTSLSAYTHYFSMLVSGLIALWGLLLIGADQKRHYLISLLVSVLLFVPHIPLTLGHLSIGGIGKGGWLDAPEPRFFRDFFEWAFQYNLIVIGFVILGLLAALIQLRKKDRHFLRSFFLSIAIFLLPLLIGYWYSVTKNPLLQFSVLIFGFPFLLLALFSYAGQLGKRWVIVVTLFMMLLNTWSLFSHRAHYHVMAHQGYDKCAEMIANENKVGVRPMVICDRNPHFLGVYKDRDGLDYDYVQLEQDCSLAALDQHLIRAGSRPVIMLNRPLSQEWMSSQRLNEVVHEEGFAFSLFRYSANRTSEDKYFDLTLRESFDTHSMLSWDYDSTRVQGSYLIMPQGAEYGLSFKSKLRDLVLDRSQTLTLSMASEIPIGSNSSQSQQMVESGVLVMELIPTDGSAPIWHGEDFNGNTFYKDGQAISVMGIRLSDVIPAHKTVKEYSIKLYFWNKGKVAYNIDWIQLDIGIDSPLRYGLFKALY